MSVLCVRGAELIMCAAHVSLLQQRPDDELIMPARTHASGRVLSCVVCCRVLSCVVVGADATTTLFCQLHCFVNYTVTVQPINAHCVSICSLLGLLGLLGLSVPVQPCQRIPTLPINPFNPLE